MFSVWCEWDVGQEHMIFASVEEGKEWLSNNYYMQEIIEENGDWESVSDVIAAGLVGFNELTQYKKKV